MVLGVCALMLAAGFLFKGQCLEPWVDLRQYERLCYNDIQPLYAIRGIEERLFPYIGGSLLGGQLVNGAIEYPVLTGVFMWASGHFAADVDSYLVVSAALLAPFGLIAAYLLGRLAGWRALMWAAAPGLILYSFHNWDLLVVAAACAGIYAWATGRYRWSAVWFGIGAAFKMYPIFFLAPLSLDRWRSGDRKGAAATLAAGVGTVVAINLPFAVRNFDGWSATYVFHQARTADFNSIWHWATPDLALEKLNLYTAALTAAFFGIALAAGWWRARRDGVYPFLQVCAAMLAAFLLWNKVHSPQYALWLLPFFVLVRVHVALWAAYSLVDLAFYVGIFRWFYDMQFRGVEDTLMKQVMLASLWGRAALLLVLFVAFLMAPSAVARHEEQTEEVVSHPPSSLSGVGESAPAPS
ncbi:MAG: glycosyltransferase 87 family protein [Actinomycetota bacterium]|nr:glycosyltransferase 87 family protein [Actinomycetota bacterium]